MYILDVFCKTDESFVRDIMFKQFPLQEMRALFNVDDDDPGMYYCYPVTIKQKEHIEKYIDEVLDLDKYDYFVSGVSTSE